MIKRWKLWRKIRRVQRWKRWASFSMAASREYERDIQEHLYTLKREYAELKWNK